MTEKYEVRFAIEVRASSPEQAATIARDMLLDLDTELHANVHALEFYEPAEDWFPCEDRGVAVYFGDRRPAYIYGGTSSLIGVPACGRSSASPGSGSLCNAAARIWLRSGADQRRGSLRRSPWRNRAD